MSILNLLLIIHYMTLWKINITPASDKREINENIKKLHNVHYRHFIDGYRLSIMLPKRSKSVTSLKPTIQPDVEPI